MVNYKNGKIYKVIDFTTNTIYIGSTCDTLSRRLTKHRSNYKQSLKGNYGNCRIHDILKNDNYKILLIKECPCDNKEQLEAIEGEYIQKLDCVNKNLPTRRSPNERAIEYRRNNIETVKIAKHIYYESHKDQILKKEKAQRDFSKSWGGDKRCNNNLLCIDPFLFT